MKKTYSLATKIVAGLTAASFVAMGCAAQDPESDPDLGGQRLTLETWANVPDENGVNELRQLGSQEVTVDDIMVSQRTFVIDGVETTDLARIMTGSEIVVPLNTGETATLSRRGDRLELVDFTGEDDGTSDVPRGAVHAVQLVGNEVQVFLAGSAGPDADLAVRLSGIEELDERTVVMTALALDALLASLEDREQIAAGVAIALIAAAMGVIWMAACGGLAIYCANHCSNRPGFDTQCAGFTVRINRGSTNITLGGGYSCHCL